MAVTRTVSYIIMMKTMRYLTKLSKMGGRDRSKMSNHRGSTAAEEGVSCNPAGEMRAMVETSWRA